MKLSFLDSLIHYYGRTWWAPLVVQDIGRFLEKGETVLDIGAGGGWIGELLQKELEAQVTLLDVADLNRTKLPLVVYNGTSMPFADNSFDTSLLLFVLHHCQDPLAVLREAVRVSSKRLIIFEDTFSSPFGKFLAGANDFISNSPFFIADPHKMNMPYNYKRVEEWEEIFAKLSLRVRFKRVTNHPITKHVLFVVEK